MKMSKGQSNSHAVKLSSLLRELSCLSEMHEQFSTPHEFHNKEDFSISLENVFHTYKEWMISLKQNFLLEHCGLNLIVVNNHILSKRFHGIHFSILDFLYEKDLSKTSLTDNTFNCKIFKINLLLILVFDENTFGSSVA